VSLLLSFEDKSGVELLLNFYICCTMSFLYIPCTVHDWNKIKPLF